MARNFWQTRRKSLVTKRINKKLILPSFSYDCFYPEQSLKSVDDIGGSVEALALFPESFKDAFTIEFWAFTYNTVSSSVLLAVQSVTSNDTVIQFGVSTNILNLTVYTAGGGLSISSTGHNVPVGQWFHCAGVFNGTAIQLYLDGELVAQGNVPGGGPLKVTALVYDVFLFGDKDGGNLFYGYLDEIRAWTSVKSAADIKFFYDKHMTPDAANLAAYINLDDATDTGGTLSIPNDITGGSDLNLVNEEEMELNTDKTAPLILGTSFVVAEYSVSLSKSVSLKYPIENPEGSDLNFGLYVSWFDEDDVFQRRKLFAPSGIKIAPIAADYAGEKLATSFKLEIWNVDGEVAVSLTNDLILYISETSAPEDETDHESVAAATLTEDNTLAEPFPLTDFPLEFNSSQTY